MADVAHSPFAWTHSGRKSAGAATRERGGAARLHRRDRLRPAGGLDRLSPAHGADRLLPGVRPRGRRGRPAARPLRAADADRPQPRHQPDRAQPRGRTRQVHADAGPARPQAPRPDRPRSASRATGAAIT